MIKFPLDDIKNLFSASMKLLFMVQFVNEFAGCILHTECSSFSVETNGEVKVVSTPSTTLSTPLQSVSWLCGAWYYLAITYARDRVHFDRNVDLLIRVSGKIVHYADVMELMTSVIALHKDHERSFCSVLGSALTPFSPQTRPTVEQIQTAFRDVMCPVSET